MNRKTLFVALAAIPFMLGACGDKANQTQNAEKQQETTVTDKTKESKADKKKASKSVEKDDDQTEISGIRREWASHPIENVVRGKGINIERFALAFCSEFANHKPNEVLRDYIESNKKNSEFEIQDHRKTGFMSCLFMAQYDWNTVCCFWNRNNGHKLVAFWLIEAHESDPIDEHLLTFYDYNPTTDIMTPDAALSKKVDEAMNKFDTYTVKLPDQGKDIELVGHKIDFENDSAENTYYLLRWNGYDFKMEKVED